VRQLVRQQAESWNGKDVYYNTVHVAGQCNHVHPQQTIDVNLFNEAEAKTDPAVQFWAFQQAELTEWRKRISQHCA
jgi:hypothetical protein